MQSTEDDQRRRRREEGGRRMKKKGAAAGALARVRGMMGTLPSFSMSTTRRRGHGHGHGYDGPGPGPDPPRPGEELLQLELALQGQGQEQQQEENQHEEEEENRPRGPWTSVKTAVDRHELISFLDDADADDFSPSSFLAAPTNAADDTTTTSTTTATSSIFIIDRDEDEDETQHSEDGRDDGLAHLAANNHNITTTTTNNKKNIDANTATTTTTTTTTTATHALSLLPLVRESSFYSSARSSFESTNLTALSAATTAATTTITTTTMAPLTAPDAKDGGRATTAAPAETTTRTSADGCSAFVDDWSRDLWDYLHHGLDGQSSPDLRLLLQNDYPSLLSSSSEQEQEHADGDADGSMHRLHQRDAGYHRHLHQQQQQQEQEQQQKFEPPSSSSTYHQVLNDIRPESSRSFQNRLNNNALCRNNSQHHYSHFRGASTESAGAATATWTLRSGRSHEKSNSGSSKTTTATAMTIPTIISGSGGGGGAGARESKATATGMTASTTATTSATTTASTNTTKTTTLSAPSSTMLAAGGLPPVSPSTASFGAEMTKQEFEALPEAIQRKYFSSLERLHFASLAPAPPATPDYINSFFDRPETSPNPQTLKQRRRARQAKLASDSHAERFKRRNSRRSRVTSTSSSVYVRLPDKIKRRHLTTEEQLVSSTNRRHDIILDPADEAIYRVRRRASSLVIPDELWSPTLSVRPQTMESQPSQKQPPKTSPAPQEKKPKSPPKAPQRPMPTSPQKKRDSFYDSFRWLEDDDLDLRLHLDDYHANLREDLPTPSKQRRPSFRRHLSISKIPFGRTSLSMNRPGTTQAVVTSHPSSPLFGNAPSSPHASSPGHGRRRSRALSLIAPKHSPQDALGVFDPEAAHYQDPEARLKLRVYLASPQKFDEAIEFGFPSKEAMTPQAVRELKDPKARRTKALPSDESDNLRTFLADDRSSIYSEDGSLDSDSPKTPQTVENSTALRPPPVKSDRAYSPKPSHEYAPAETREMTLRMTLTRPDLRAHEDQIYGWQPKCCPPGRKSQSNALRDELPAASARDGSSKESIERQLAAMDQWNAQTSDRGVMKRFWNKVRRGPT